MRIRSKWWAWLSLVIILFTLAIYFGCAWVEMRIRAAIHQAGGKFASVTVSAFSRSVKVDSLQLELPTSAGFLAGELRVKKIQVSGVSLLTILTGRSLDANELQIENGSVRVFHSKKRGEAGGSYKPGLEFSCQRVNLSRIYFEGRVDSSIHYSAQLNGKLGKVRLELDVRQGLRYSVADIDAEVTDATLDQKMYQYAFKRLTFNSSKQRIVIDSMQLKPRFSKYDFAHVMRKQTVKMDLMITRLKLAGVDLHQLLKQNFKAASLTIDSFALRSFKDKRIPFLSTKVIPLPMSQFIALPWRVQIDSLMIGKSHISIEEFPKGGVESGTVTFEEVEVIALGITNRFRNIEKESIALHATALLMGAGKISASFQFPLSKSQPYRAYGSIGNMRLQKLNPLLKPWANMRIESGFLDLLKFDFSYTEFNSHGSLDIAYGNLEMTGLDKNKDTDSAIKTFLLNTFIRKEKTRPDLADKRTGIINVERDRRRYIFHIWLTSIADGLKSSLLGGRKK